MATSTSSLAAATEMAPTSIGKAFVIVSGPALISLVPMAIVPALPALAAEFARGGDGALFAQLVMTVPAVMVIIAAAVAAFLADRWGRRPVLLMALVCYVAAGLAGVLAHTSTTLIASRLLLGFGAGTIMTLSLAMLSDYPEGPRRNRVLGYASASAALMAVLALTLGGVLVDMLNWHGPFMLYALGLPVLWVAFRVVRNRPRMAVDDGSREPLWRAVWPVILLTLTLTIGLFMPGVQGPFLLQAEGITSAGTQGLILASYSLTTAVVAALYGRVFSHLPLPVQIACAAAALGGGCLAMALLHGGQTTLLIGCIVMGVGAGLVEPVTISLMLRRAPTALHTRAIGLLLSAVFLGQFLNPLIVDPVRTGYGIHGAFIFAGVFFVALALVVLAASITKLGGRFQT